MKNKTKSLSKILLITFVLLFAIFSNKVFALGTLTVAEETEEYKAYMELSDEEKEGLLEPKRYNVISSKTITESLTSTNNVFKVASLLSNTLGGDYNLRDIIGNNVVIRNQMQTDSCWAFAGIGVLESNLAMLNYKVGITDITYNFSERHLFYGARRYFFNNNEENEYGYSTEEKGGNWNEVQSYLSNGFGAIDEDEMPFVNDDGNIDISLIQNKEVLTTLYDTIEFETLTDVSEEEYDTKKAELIAKMKQTISSYGGIFAGVNGAQIISDAYNNLTGAMYCSNTSEYPMNHAVVIIGWNDDYEVEKFNENNRPTSPGAWIVKNSWGDEISTNLAELKEDLYNAQTDACNQLGWYSPEAIPDSTMVQLYENAGYGEGKVYIDGDDLVIEIGDEGYMYISYEDANIYRNLYAIKKASDEKDYDELYQYSKLVASIPISYSESEVYIASKFTRTSTTEDEYIDKISIYTLQEVTCTVYVNSESNELSKDKLQKVKLENGDSIVLEPGFHVIEFEDPIQLTGTSFAVALNLVADGDTVYFMEETKATDDNVEISTDRCFYTNASAFEADYWVDLGTYETESVRGNLSIKAYTSYGGVQEETPTLEKIEVTTNPSKLEYTEGESFDRTGMVVTATYTDGSTKPVTEYEIEGGDNLTPDKNYITIKYTENGVTKYTTLNITVNEADDGDDDEDQGNIGDGDNTGDGGSEENTGDGDNTGDDEDEYPADEPQVSPVLSDFTNMVAEIESANIYFFEDDEKTNIDMEIQMSYIINGSDTTNYTYYYYFSGSDSEENISDWVKMDSPTITVNSDGTKTITFNVNTNDIPNNDELTDVNNIYLYIKEEAEAGGQTIEQVVVRELTLAENAEVTTYYENEQIGTIEDVINISGNNHNSGNSSTGDDTTATGKLPQTGVVSFVVVLIVIFVGRGVYTFVRQRNIIK